MARFSKLYYISAGDVWKTAGSGGVLQEFLRIGGMMPHRPVLQNMKYVVKFYIIDLINYIKYNYIPHRFEYFTRFTHKNTNKVKNAIQLFIFASGVENS